MKDILYLFCSNLDYFMEIKMKAINESVENGSEVFACAARRET
jgi:hypothetical protein